MGVSRLLFWRRFLYSQLLRHVYGGALNDREMIVHMGVGAIAGGILGGLLVSAAPAALLKTVFWRHEQ
jgi:uncharacterized membrane protein YfcA